MILPRTGCPRFEQIQGRPASAVEGRLGVMARVIAGGTIRMGDPVLVVAGPAGGPVAGWQAAEAGATNANRKSRCFNHLMDCLALAANTHTRTAPSLP